MKVIFEETQAVEFDELVHHYNFEFNLTRQRGLIKTRTFYDKRTGALVIDHKCFFGRSWTPADRRSVELHPTREAALRRTIEVADAWRDEVQAAVPAEPEEFVPDD
ncbi:hypothetical protein [Kouleothrix sp.]|uniref:hypothetical protein n=1 Tax=Kouleothrix sp. TaxID=2779161 RepID=UPI00391D0E34